MYGQNLKFLLHVSQNLFILYFHSLLQFLSTQTFFASNAGFTVISECLTGGSEKQNIH